MIDRVDKVRANLALEDLKVLLMVHLHGDGLHVVDRRASCFLIEVNLSHGGDRGVCLRLLQDV